MRNRNIKQGSCHIQVPTLRTQFPCRPLYSNSQQIKCAKPRCNLTDSSASACQIVATVRHVRHLLRHRGTSGDTLALLYLCPWYDSVSFRSRRGVRVPTRAIDFRFRKVNLERTNPFVAPNRCTRSSTTTPFSMSRASIPFKEPCCQLLLYIISAFKVIFSWSGMSFATSMALGMESGFDPDLDTYQEQLCQRTVGNLAARFERSQA